jgi:signal transduction histidine kinase
VATPSLSTLATLLWLLGAGGASCLLLRRAIDADDRARDLATRLVREQDARRAGDAILADTQTVLSKLVRQQDSARDSERGRIAREIHDELGQTLLTLRVELCLLQASAHGVQPSVHARTGAMIGTLDLALHSLRAVVNGLRPLALNEGLRAALERQLAEFTRLNGIAHQLEIAPGTLTEPECAAFDVDALLYRVLQEALAELADQASATEVRVRLQRGDAGLTLRINDNGDGNRHANERCNPRCRCGLAGMRERVEAAGGALRIAAAPGGGTVLALTLPPVRGLALS